MVGKRGEAWNQNEIAVFEKVNLKDSSKNKIMKN